MVYQKVPLSKGNVFICSLNFTLGPLIDWRKVLENTFSIELLNIDLTH